MRYARYPAACFLARVAFTSSFIALPVIPELKITDMGLVDVEGFRVIEPLVG